MMGGGQGPQQHAFNRKETALRATPDSADRSFWAEPLSSFFDLFFLFLIPYFLQHIIYATYNMSDVRF